MEIYVCLLYTSDTFVFHTQCFLISRAWCLQNVVLWQESYLRLAYLSQFNYIYTHTQFAAMYVRAKRN